MPITTEIIYLNSGVASELLGRNTGNRPVKNRVIEVYKTDMVNGDWKFTAEPIKIDRNGNLIDGQHRCMAIMAAQSESETPISFQVLLVRGLEPESQDVMDSGTRRSVADQLARRGAHSYSQTSAAIRCILAYRTGNDRPPRSEMIQFYDEYAEILKEGLTICTLHSNTSSLSPSAMLAAWFLISEVCADADDVATYFHLLQRGVDLPEDSPVLALRNRAFIAKQRRENITNVVATAMIVRTWNYWRTGQPMRKVPSRSRSGGGVEIKKIES